MANRILLGHFLALLSNVIWGSTFISTKVLLADFSPTAVMFIRFLLAFILICIICPKRFPKTNFKTELLLLLAGICGVTCYYQLENIALTYTYASNVGVIFAIIPFFVGIEALFLLKSERISALFIVGFLIAITGICIISFNGAKNFNLNPYGDLLACIGCVVWSFYAIIVKKLSIPNVSVMLLTKRIFMYAIICMIPCMFIFDKGFSIDFAPLLKPINMANFAYLAIGASVCCYIAWNVASNLIGVLATSVYIYVGPIVTVLLSFVILDEHITWVSCIGIFLTLLGLFVSQLKQFFKLKEIFFSQKKS